MLRSSPLAGSFAFYQFRMQFIFFRLSIFNEVISLSMKHIGNRIFRSFIFCPFHFLLSFYLWIWIRFVESYRIYLSVCVVVILCSFARDFHLLSVQSRVAFVARKSQVCQKSCLASRIKRKRNDI